MISVMPPDAAFGTGSVGMSSRRALPTVSGAATDRGPRCVECPVLASSGFEEELGDAPGCCRFVKATLAERAPLPREWADRYAFALVRRGVVVRTRDRAGGRAVAVDCVGAGAFMPLANEGGDLGYAATGALFCLYPRDILDHRLGAEAPLARDLARGLSAALTRVERFAEARGLPRAPERVTSVLSVLFTELAPEPIEVLPAGLLQRDIGKLAGVRHESVCRILGQLERTGTIARRGGELVALRREALSAGG